LAYESDSGKLSPMRSAPIWLALLGALASCGRSAEEKRARCHDIVFSRNVIGADPAGDGKALLALLRCDLHDTIVAGGVLDEMSRVCGVSSHRLIELSNVDIEGMYPPPVVERADEAGCGELRLAGRAIFVHPGVARALAELSTPP
jgi:hypothetical protein